MRNFQRLEMKVLFEKLLVVALLDAVLLFAARNGAFAKGRVRRIGGVVWLRSGNRGKRCDEEQQVRADDWHSRCPWQKSVISIDQRAKHT